MPRPLLLSLLLHGVLILVAIFGLPRFSAPPEPIEALEVSLISAADLAGQGGAPSQDPEPVQDPEPAPVAPPPAPTPEVAPEPAAPLPSDEPDLVDSTPPPVDRVAPTPSPESDLPDGPTLVTPRAETETPSEADPEETPEPQAPEEASPQTVTEAVETEDRPNLRVATSPIPAPRPARPRPVEPTPEPEPVEQPEPSPEVPPAPTPDPEPVDPIAAAVADALAGVSDPTPDPAPAGPPLTSGEETALRRAVSRCWNFAGMSTEAMRVTITIAMDMTPQATIVQGSMALKSFEGGSQAAADAAYRAARSALFRCQGSGYPLPAEKYESWKQIEMTFNPERMRLR